jgi:hypothetical protein
MESKCLPTSKVCAKASVTVPLPPKFKDTSSDPRQDKLKTEQQSRPYKGLSKLSRPAEPVHSRTRGHIWQGSSQFVSLVAPAISDPDWYSKCRIPATCFQYLLDRFCAVRVHVFYDCFLLVLHYDNLQLLVAAFR